MGAQGTTTVDFGAFPGASDASVTVTGQAGIAGGSLVEAWLYPSGTADHSADEHLVETLKVVAGSVVGGTGFTVYAFNTNPIAEPLEDADVNGFRPANILATGPYGGKKPSVGGRGTRIYGQWTVAWVWN